jgi:hypothetical protein
MPTRNINTCLTRNIDTCPTRNIDTCLTRNADILLTCNIDTCPTRNAHTCQTHNTDTCLTRNTDTCTIHNSDTYQVLYVFLAKNDITKMTTRRNPKPSISKTKTQHELSHVCTYVYYNGVYMYIMQFKTTWSTPSTPLTTLSQLSTPTCWLRYPSVKINIVFICIFNSVSTSKDHYSS